MSISINTNVGASLAAYNLGAAGVNLRRSLERHSSGSRINPSYDDGGGDEAQPWTGLWRSECYQSIPFAA